MARKFDISFSDINYGDKFNLVEVLNVENDTLTGIFELKKLYSEYFTDYKDDEVEIKVSIVVDIQAKIDLTKQKILQVKLIKFRIRDMSCANTDMLEQDVYDMIEESNRDYYDTSDIDSYDDTVSYGDVEVIENDN
jgi:hypothetical protein